MSDPEFERRLVRFLADTPALADVDAFARRVQQRLDRSWTLRRALIGLAGLVGGLFAAGQMLGPYVFHGVAKVSHDSVFAAMQTGKAIAALRLLGDLPVAGEVLWVGVGLGVLAVAFLATRLLESQ